jgi:hypothetical protein
MTTSFQDRSAFYTTGALGKTRRTTPEGFLVCEGVPIARIGTQIYSTHEISGLTGDARGEIRIERRAEDVFRPDTLASFEGKPITIDHPFGAVTPENWAQLAHGTVHNARRGEGIESDLVIADLMIKTAHAIQYVNDELPQVSCGYDAEYEQSEPGRGIQRNIIGNHVALVKRGRAGMRCAIKDSDQPIGARDMKKAFVLKFLQSIGVKDAEAAADVLEQASGDSKPTTDGVQPNPLEQRVLAIETGITELKALLTKQTTDAAKDEQDEQAAAAAAAAAKPAFTADAVKEVVARAEILAPGIQLPTADALKDGAAVEKLMRESLEKANASDEGKDTIKTFLGAREIKALTGDALAGVFTGAAEVTRTRNNSKTTKNPFASSGNVFVGTQDGKRVTTADRVAEQQKSINDFWSKQKAS